MFLQWKPVCGCGDGLVEACGHTLAESLRDCVSQPVLVGYAVAATGFVGPKLIGLALRQRVLPHLRSVSHRLTLRYDEAA
jgi:hypothetical protein